MTPVSYLFLLSCVGAIEKIYHFLYITSGVLHPTHVKWSRKLVRVFVKKNCCTILQHLWSEAVCQWYKMLLSLGNWTKKTSGRRWRPTNRESYTPGPDCSWFFCIYIYIYICCSTRARFFNNIPTSQYWI